MSDRPILSANLAGVDIYNKAKNYIRRISQNGKGISHGDENDGHEITTFLIKDLLQQLTHDNFQKSGWKVVENTGAEANNIKITGGFAYPGGWQAYLDSDTAYDNSGLSIAQKNLHSISTALTADILTDNTANWKTGELIGRKLRPNISDATSYTIVGNTSTSITVVGGSDMTLVASVGNNYLVELLDAPSSNPSGPDRLDTVIINVWPREVDGNEDADLLAPLAGGTEIDRRIKIMTVIHVLEDNVTHGSYASTYVDGNGTTHYILELAEIERVFGQSNILTANITDKRAESLLARLERWTGSTNELKDTVAYTSTNFINNTMDFMAALARLDEVVFSAGSGGDLGNLSDKVGEDLASPLTPGSIPDYSSDGSNNFAIGEGDPHRKAIALLDLQIERISSFVGRVVGDSLPTYTSTNYILAADPVETAIGKLDAALKAEDVQTGVDIGTAITTHETEMAETSKTPGPTGAAKVGVDPTDIQGTASTTVQTVLEDIAHRRVHEWKAITISNTIPDLAYTPRDDNQVILLVEGMPQVNGSDFTVSGKTVSWVPATAGFSLDSGDSILFIYSTKE